MRTTMTMDGLADLYNDRQFTFPDGTWGRLVMASVREGGYTAVVVKPMGQMVTVEIDIVR
jgi:hypothetical protein